MKLSELRRRLSEAGIGLGIASSKSPRSIAETMGDDGVRGLFRGGGLQSRGK